jgi:hypothetical protein
MARGRRASESGVTEPSSGNVTDWVQPVLDGRKTVAAVSEGAEAEILAFIEKVLERGVDRAGKLAGSALVPWGGAEACIDAYEDRVRASAEMQLTVARALRFEPARSLAATYMDVTRDIVAAQVSSARWLFDV